MAPGGTGACATRCSVLAPTAAIAPRMNWHELATTSVLSFPRNEIRRVWIVLLCHQIMFFDSKKFSVFAGGRSCSAIAVFVLLIEPS
jgi:hypothetical protein